MAVSAGYFLLASFAIIGNLFVAESNVEIPIYGILLTLPWSLLAALIKYSSATAGLAALEICALLNSILLYFLIRAAQRPTGRRIDEQNSKRKWPGADVLYRFGIGKYN